MTKASITRRDALLLTLFGGGFVGLRALATGLPASLFADPKKALAHGSAASASREKAQFIVLSTSGDGDSINACVPGTYEDPRIVHSRAPEFAPAPLAIRGKTYTAAAPWGKLPARVLDRTVFWHMMTDTPVHSKEPDVLKLMGGTEAKEMFPSLLAKALAPCLDTIQKEPISVGALTPSEGLSFGGAALPVVPPLALKATLASPEGPLAGLQDLRRATLNQLFDLYKNGATASERRYLDSLMTSHEQVRHIEQDLLHALSTIHDNGADSQVKAALALIRMRVSPVVTIHVPFGGDNHRDIDLAAETAQSISGIATIASLMDQLERAGLEDRVMFATLNVFGRTLGPGHENGRHHNANHQVSIAIGRALKGGVIGGVGPVSPDYGALAIDSKSGAAEPGGDVRPIDTMAAYAQTLLAAIGAPPTLVQSPGGTGRVIAAALS
jgi:hypothetical protein